MTLAQLASLPMWEWPADGPALVGAGLASADPVERGLAVELASHLHEDDRLVNRLVDVLEGDPSPEVRARAAISLGPALEACDLGLADPDEEPGITEATFERACRALEAAVRSTTNPDRLRRCALEGAVRAARPWQVPFVREACAHPDPAWRATGVFCTAYHGELGDLAIAALDDRAVEVRIQAVRAVGELGAAGVAERLIAIVQDRATARELRLTAIEALGHLRSVEAARVLGRLTTSQDRALADAASHALTEIAFSLDLGDDDDDDDDN